MYYVKDVAEILCLSKTTIYKKIESGIYDKYISQSNGVKTISSEGIEEIRESITEKERHTGLNKAQLEVAYETALKTINELKFENSKLSDIVQDQNKIILNQSEIIIKTGDKNTQLDINIDTPNEYKNIGMLLNILAKEIATTKGLVKANNKYTLTGFERVLESYDRLEDANNKLVNSVNLLEEGMREKRSEKNKKMSFYQRLIFLFKFL